ncbi:hypothetical protein QBC43DRAFT_350400 [Cladorrhinum sp. PSN259]|nr:hypothetical protein QBC43DRAFT_350400 [Cladorrhinum sp. PSN259]
MADFEPVPASQGKLLEELSFENIIKNKTTSPCSLGDFMEYLYHIEHNAECLQFFLWYTDYVQRWSQLLPRQKALSPAWDPEKVSSLSHNNNNNNNNNKGAQFITYSHKRARSLKMNKIISILGMSSSALPSSEMAQDQAQDDVESQPHTGRKHSNSLSSVFSSSSKSTFTRSHRSISSVSTNTTSSHSRIPSQSLLSPSSSIPPKPDWKPFTIPPHQTELSLIIRHYLTSAQSSPRFLSVLSPQDQQSCLLACQHTTHPSALLPAFLTCESLLRNNSHPNFIRWAARRNANGSRLLCLKLTAGVLISLGLVVDIVLILSSFSPLLRVICLGLWWIGLAIGIAAWKGEACLWLVLGERRQKWVWEEENENKKDEKRLSIVSGSGSRSSDEGHVVVELDVDVKFQTFGPRNDEGAEEKWNGREIKGWMERVWDDTVTIEDKGVMMMQDRVVFFAVLWGGVLATGLTVGSLFVPRGDLF